MKTTQLAALGFTLFWLAILAIFSFGLGGLNGLIAYALLAMLVGLRRSYLVNAEDGRCTAAALAYGAALYFGPVGGAIVGAVAAFGRNVDTQGGMSAGKLLWRSAWGAAAGLAAGLAYGFAGPSLIPFGLAGKVALAILAAAACLLVVAIAGLLENRRGIYRSISERLGASALLSGEFAVGVGLAVSIQVVYISCASEQLLVLMPVVYLAKKSLDELLASSKPVSFKVAEDKLSELYLASIHSLIAAIDARDRFTRAHTMNVTKLALSIGRRMNLSKAGLEALKMAALFHDVGKLWVPEHILLKPGRLTPEQFAKIQQHPALSQKILENVNFPWPIGPIVRAHHERWDGTGYPDHLKGEQIPLGARILCLADVYDAMTSKRSYRPSNGVEVTLRYIKGAAGTYFDPAVVRAFEQVIAGGELPGVDRSIMVQAVDKAADTPAAREKGGAEDISAMSGEFVAMFEIAQAASTSLNLGKVLYLLAGKIKSMISCASCVIFLREKDSDQLEVEMALGANSQYFEGGRTAIGDGQTGAVVETGEGTICGYDKREITLPALLEPWAKLDEWVEFQSTMIAPITVGESVLGTINLYHSEPNAFSDEDFRLLLAVAQQASKAIQNALLYRRTSETAMTDALTGLHNARYLFKHLEQVLNRAKRTKKPVSVLGMDLDNFKAINDTFGHQQGDTTLKEMAQVFLSQVRDYDMVCRYAGDEFVIVLPDADNAQAMETARRIEEAVDMREPYGSDDKQIRVGVSVGVATYPEDGQDVRSLIARADVNMYAAKKRRKERRAA